jgi:hypothetical protein
MRILAIISGDYGERHVTNIRHHGPKQWNIRTWQAPSVFPVVIDYPDDHLPGELNPADLILSFAENKGVAELIPDIAEMTGAKAVIAAIDNEAWLPRGLARQLRVWLEKMNIACATPKPLCSLTDHDYGVTRRKRLEYKSVYISEFAQYFGQPSLNIQINPQTRMIEKVEVSRDAVCGCARYVAEGLIGLSADDAEEKGGLLHHHYPCLASMSKDSDFGDTLMHISGNVLKENIGEQVKPYKTIKYISPGKRSE